MAKKKTKPKTRLVALVGLILMISVGLIIVYVPVQSEEVQCITAPCPPIQKTMYDLILEHFEQNKEPVFCIEIFQPVCGTDGITYSNSCFADGAGVQIDHQGEC